VKTEIKIKDMHLKFELFEIKIFCTFYV